MSGTFHIIALSLLAISLTFPSVGMLLLVLSFALLDYTNHSAGSAIPLYRPYSYYFKDVSRNVSSFPSVSFSGLQYISDFVKSLKNTGSGTGAGRPQI